ncbi:GGDEF domain-containing protein [Thomasclavelia sp.]
MKKTIKEAESFCCYVAHEYLENRNYELLCNIIDENISIIGTGAHEISHNARELMIALHNESELWDGTFKIEDEWYQANEIRENLFIVFGEVKAKQNCNDQLLYDFSSRITFVLEFKNDNWKVLHVHQSMPDFSQGDDEFFPHRIIEESKLQLEKQIAQKTKELEMSNQQVLYNLKHDYLTGVLNRHYFEEELKNKIIDDNKWAIIIIDIDYFKSVNDNYGHPFGDQVLIKLADTMKDSFGKDCCGPIGGDEFVAFVLFSNYDQIKDHINNFKNNWDKNIAILNSSKQITLSIGIAYYPEHGADYNELLSNADKALYLSKNNGRNRISAYKC